MCVYPWKDEVQLTCKRAHIPPQGMSHDPGNTAEDNLKITRKKLNISSKIHKKLFLCSLSLSPAVIHPSPLLTGNSRTLKHVAAPTPEHEISELWCRGGKRCTIDHHPLNSTESARMYIKPL